MPPVRRRRRTAAVPPEKIPWLRYDRFSRSVTERLRVRPLPGHPFFLLAVRNPVHHTRYQVALPEYPAEGAQFCSCVDFSRKGIGTCKHIEAARAWVAAHPEAAPSAPAARGTAALWKAIHAEQTGPGELRLDAVSLRAPGRSLFERSGSAEKRRGRGSGPPGSKA